MSVRLDVQVCVRLANRMGAASQLMEVLHQDRCALLAHCIYHERLQTVVLLVAEDSDALLACLKRHRIDAAATRVLVSQSEYVIGLPAQLGAMLANAGVQIHYSYATCSGRDQLLVVFKTSDDQRALRVLEQNPPATGLQLAGGVPAGASADAMLGAACVTH